MRVAFHHLGEVVGGPREGEIVLCSELACGVGAVEGLFVAGRGKKSECGMVEE